jgi:hypothetical protein
MAECPHCEYNKKRAQNWREEAYRLAGHPLPRKETMTEDDDDIQAYVKPWVGLTRDEQSFVYQRLHDATSRIDSFWVDFANAIEAKLKEKNA